MLSGRSLRFALTAPAWHWRTVLLKPQQRQGGLLSIQAFSVDHKHQQLLLSNSARSFATKHSSKKGRKRFDREPKENDTAKHEAPVQTASARQSHETDNEDNSRSWILVAAAGVGVYVAGVWIAMKYTGFTLFKTEDPASVTEQHRRGAFDKGAKTYDEEVCAGEWLMGITKLRKRLLAIADGEVLEVAAGTGHNFPLYPDTCKITATDCSQPMLEVASGKAGRPSGAVTLRVMDAEALAFPDASFDTVVDTFGLCSVQDPVASLREMQRVCRQGGRVLLLEHGASSWGILTSLLDGASVNHAKRWGCWWNRDIMAVANASGLKILQMERHHLGTTYWIVAEPCNKA